MQILIEQIVNGLTLGAMYASVAVGLSLVFGVVGLVNFAQGDTFMIASYLFYIVYSGGSIPYPLAVIIVIGLTFIFGVVFETVVVRPVFDLPRYTQVIATLAAGIILREIARLIWGSTPRAAPTPYLKSFVEIPYLGVFSYQRIIIVLVTILSFWGLHLFLQETKYGKAMRAVSQNREASSVVGINVRAIARLSFAISSALAGLGACVVSPMFNIFPDMGLPLILRAFAAIVVGGYGQVTGAIYSSLLLGLAESLTTGYISTALKDIVAISVLVLVLIFRPQGILGRKRVGI